MENNNTYRYPNLSIKKDNIREETSIEVKYSSFLNNVNNLDKSPVVFSTTKMLGTISGFLKLNNDFYLKIEIIHVSGYKGQKFDFMDRIKISVDKIRQRIIWTISNKTITRDLLNGEDIELNIKFESKLFKGLFTSITITSDPNMSEKITDTLKVKAKNRVIKDTSLKKLKDFADADRFTYNIGPNTDVERSRYEYFAGSGSNISGKRIR